MLFGLQSFRINFITDFLDDYDCFIRTGTPSDHCPKNQMEAKVVGLQFEQTPICKIDDVPYSICHNHKKAIPVRINFPRVGGFSLIRKWQSCLLRIHYAGDICGCNGRIPRFSFDGF
jgi:hypothetical protein